MNRNTSKESIKNLSIRQQIILGTIGAVIAITAVVALNSKKSTKTQMSITEAQEKCVLMEEADMVNYMGEPFSKATTEKAEKFCLSQWDEWENPNNTEEKFIEIIQKDWEERKEEVLEGYTLQQLYNESKNSSK